jgi:hypothetical protein
MPRVLPPTNRPPSRVSLRDGKRPRSTSVAALRVGAESSPRIMQKTIFGATENMKKISWTILWLSLHFPKTLKNAYIRAVFSLFADPNL